MAFRPPKGVRPPQLEGKRTGRPKGSKTHARVWADILWGFRHRFEERVNAPNPSALWWYRVSYWCPYEMEEFLESWGKI
jgi:hypothetical protein